MSDQRNLVFALILLPVALFCLSCGNGKYSDITVLGLRVNAEPNPAGIDSEKPVFSWKLSSEKRNRYQSAWQLVVFDRLSGDTCWNSGKIRTGNSISVPYAGKALEPVHPYTWKVRIWDPEGTASRWSGESSFTTGLLSENDWRASWTGSPDPAYSPVFIREFSLEGIPGRATVFVNGQGYYELFVNGEKAGTDVLSPAVSDFRHETYYLTYDIRELLRPGKNIIGVWTGRGWYSQGLPGVAHHSPVFRLQAHFDFGDKQEILVSDTSWITFNSNISQIGNWRWNQMGGELVDGRIAIDMRGDHPSGRNPKQALKIAPPAAITTAQACRPNRITGALAVKSITRVDGDAWLVDFGTNFTGWMKMEIRNQNPGDTIDFIYSDFCNKIPERKSRYTWDFGNAYIDQRDGYICPGEGTGTFCPKFNFHAFRYVIIQGLNHEPLAADITGFLIESDLTESGTFSCSDPDLNAIYRLNRYTFQCLDAGGYYVDCPHRERLGYGDGQVAVETGIFSYDLENFYKKWSLNWLKAQLADGSMPNTAPSPYDAGGGPGWGGTSVVLPWKIFRYYGDTTFLQTAYPSMKKYVDYLETKSREGILIHYGDPVWGFIGDWVPPGRGMDSQEKVGETEKEVFNNCYKLYLYRILAECAEILGITREAEGFGTQCVILANQIHNRYYNTEKGTYANGEQPYLSFPLLLDVPPETERQRVLQNLEHEIRVTNGGHLNTGMLGTYFMLQYLTGIGRSDLVYLIMKQKTYPGWGFMIAQGATTCWEQWNGYWSNIHSCFTSAGGWFPAGIAGIGQSEKSAAFKNLRIIPQLTGEIDSQETIFQSSYGQVRVAWTHPETAVIELEIEIPVNTTAEIVLPVNAGQTVYESGLPLASHREIKILASEAGRLALQTGSGRYCFRIASST